MLAALRDERDPAILAANDLLQASPSHAFDVFPG
jgi:hypothetical protein